jgi:hypothetical protein
MRSSHRVVHSGFVEVAIILGKAGVANAFMNQDLRAHWNAFGDTGRTNVFGGEYAGRAIWEPKPPPSEPLPESLREYASHFVTWAAEERAKQEARRRAAEELLVPEVQSARQAGEPAPEPSDSDLKRVGEYNPDDLRLARATMADPDALPEDRRAADGILRQTDFVDSSRPRAAPPSITWSLEKETAASMAELKVVEDRAAERTGGRNAGLFGEAPDYQCPELPCGDYPDGLLFRAGGGTAASASIDDESLDNSGGRDVGDARRGRASTTTMSGRKSSTGSMKQTTLASFFKKPTAKPEAPKEEEKLAASDDEDDSAESDF